MNPISTSRAFARPSSLKVRIHRDFIRRSSGIPSRFTASRAADRSHSPVSFSFAVSKAALCSAVHFFRDTSGRPFRAAMAMKAEGQAVKARTSAGHPRSKVTHTHVGIRRRYGKTAAQHGSSFTCEEGVCPLLALVVPAGQEGGLRHVRQRDLLGLMVQVVVDNGGGNGQELPALRRQQVLVAVILQARQAVPVRR